MAEIVPQQIRGDNAFRPSQQTFGAIINAPADQMQPLPASGSQAPAGPSAPPQPASSARPLPASSLPTPPTASMLPPPAPSTNNPHPLQQPPSHFAAGDRGRHGHIASESPPDIRRFELPDNVDDDDHLPIIPPSTPILPPASIAGSGSQSQSQSRSSTVASKRKYSAQDPSISSSGKRQRAGTGVGAASLHTLSHGVDTFNAQFGAFITATTQARQERQEREEHEQRKETSPERCAKAQDVVQDEHSGYLNAEQVVAICDVFETNTRAADTFLNYKKFEYRKAWVELQLKRAGFPMDNTTIDNSQ